MSTCLLVLKAADILQREKGHQAYTTDDALHTAVLAHCAT